MTAAGLKLRNIGLMQSGAGCVRDGLGDAMSAMEAGQMDRAQIQRQDSRIATHVLYLCDLIWPYIEYCGRRFWVLVVRPCGQIVWEKIQQWCGLGRAERVLCE